MEEPLARKGRLGSLFGPDELDALKSFAYLVSLVTERAGRLAAAELAGVVFHLEKNAAAHNRENDTPFSPVRIACEGTTYLVYHGLRPALESTLHTLLCGDRPRSFVIEPVEQASLFGAAVAALE
jgi:hexokinase